MNYSPKISIVTVTLNCADSALATARSVLIQDFQSYEYIVKDGGSVDGTIESLQSLGLHVSVMPDTGIYDAMNQALDLCTGEYVYFINAGDVFYSPNALSLLISHVNVSAEVYYADIHLRPMEKLQIYPDRLGRYYLFRKNICHQALLIKRELYLSSGGFDCSYKYVADQALLWKLTLGWKKICRHIPVVVASFCYGGFSTRPATESQVVAERWKLVKKHFSIWEIAVFGLKSLYFLNGLKTWLWYKLHSQIDS